MFHRISFSWLLSELSPVSIAKVNGSPSAGAAVMALTARTIASDTCAVMASWGRQAEEKSPGDGRGLGSSYRSTHSTRAGD